MVAARSNCSRMGIERRSNRSRIVVASAWRLSGLTKVPEWQVRDTQRSSPSRYMDCLVDQALTTGDSSHRQQSDSPLCGQLAAIKLTLCRWSVKIESIRVPDYMNTRYIPRWPSVEQIQAETNLWRPACPVSGHERVLRLRRANRDDVLRVKKKPRRREVRARPRVSSPVHRP